MVRESDYYIWLRDLVGNREGYSLLLKQLDSIPFTWIFALDENRSAGGILLRGRYAYEFSVDEDDVRKGPCTVFEMLIALAGHMAEQLDETIEPQIGKWFWVLVHNLHLDKFDDDNYDARGVDYIISCWLNRNYTEKGEGSLFPLKDYSGDCRNLDIWSQMNAWINENYPVDNSWLH